jgi:hypothetical protein
MLSLREKVLQESTAEQIEEICKYRGLSKEQYINLRINDIAAEEGKEIQTHRAIHERFNKWANAESIEPESFVTMRGGRLLTKNTVNLIVANRGCHKSRLAHCIAATLLSKSKSFAQLSLTYTGQDIPVVCLVDTEHSKSQLISARDRIKAMASPMISEHYFRLMSLREQSDKISETERIIEYLQFEYPQNSKLVVIDTITDLVGNYNDLDKAVRLIEMLQPKFDRYNCTLLLVIHEVYGVSGRAKARGHVGSELENKSSTVLRLSQGKKKGIQLEFHKLRDSMPRDAIGVMYCKSTGGLTFASPDLDAIEEKETGRPLSFSDSGLFDSMRALINKSVLKSEFVQQVSAKYGCTPRTVRNRLKRISGNVSIDGKLYQFSESGRGKNAKLHLHPV